MASAGDEEGGEGGGVVREGEQPLDFGFDPFGGEEAVPVAEGVRLSLEGFDAAQNSRDGWSVGSAWTPDLRAL